MEGRFFLDKVLISPVKLLNIVNRMKEIYDFLGELLECKLEVSPSKMK